MNRRFEPCLAADSNDAVRAYRTWGVHLFWSDAVHRSDAMASRWCRLGRSIWLMSWVT